MNELDIWSTVRLHHLRDLVAVAETGSLRAAARRLGLTQPSLTKSLRQLEEHTALNLLIRSKHGVVLTSAGEQLVGHARSIESEIRRTAQGLDQLRGGNIQQVSISVSMAASLNFIAWAAISMRARRPDVQLQIFEGIQERLIADVRQGVVDFAVMPVGDRSHLKDLCVRPLFETRVVVIGRTGHPKSGCRQFTELGDCDWITPRLHGSLDRIVEQRASELGMAPLRRVVQCESSSLYWNLIAGSDLVGLALAPKLESTLANAAHFSMVFDGPPLPVVSVALVHRIDFSQNALAGELADLCREAASSHVGRFVRT